MKSLIALTSTVMGSGKSTVARMLERHHGYTKMAFAAPFKRVSEALFQALGHDATDVYRFVYDDWKEKPVAGLTQQCVREHIPLIARTLVEQTGASSLDVERYLEFGSDPLPVFDLSMVGLFFRIREFLTRHLPTDEPLTSRRWQQLFGTEFGREMIHPDIWVRITMARADTLPRVVIDDMRFPNEYEAVRAAGGVCYRVHRPGASVTSQHASEGQLDGVTMPVVYNTHDLEYLRHQVAGIA